jgi:hypothetical protein
VIRLLALAIGLGLSAALVACGGGDGGSKYPESVVQDFVESCSESGAASESECQCAIDEIQQDYTLEEFTEIALEIANTGDIPTELAGPIAACIE